MPTVVNGFGTWNHGRQNTISTADFCSRCGRLGFLSSYDTRTYFVALFLPVIPLTKRRVLHLCRACNLYTDIRHKKWRAICEQVQENARQVLANRPDDSEAVAGVMNDLVQIQDREAFESVAVRIKKMHASNALVQRVLGDGYRYFGHLDDAERCFRAALKLEDTEETREGLAVVYLLLNRPDAAAPYLRHILEKSEANKTGFLYLLAQSFQETAHHDAAFALVEAVFRQFPDLANDKEWKRLRNLTQKYRGSTKPLKQPVSGTSGKRVGKRTPVWAIAGSVIVITVLIALYFYVAYAEGASRTVHVVNGLHRPYRAEIDGETMLLLPNEPIEMEMSEGRHTIRSEDLDLPATTIDIHTNMFMRPFRDEVVVINPDRVALVLWEESEYMVEPDDSAKYDYEIRTNEAVYTFPHIHFHFEEFPDEIEMDGDREMRSRVSEYEAKPDTYLDEVYEDLDDEVLLTNLIQRFRYTPNNIWYARYLALFLETDAFLQEIRNELDARPVLVDLHRIYQEVVDADWPEHDLEAEYQRLLAADPTNSDLKYLAGRSVRDVHRAMAYFREAAEDSNPYAHAAIAFAQMSVGDFLQASRHIDEALALAPRNESFLATQRTILLGRRDLDSFLAVLPEEPPGVPEDFATLETTVTVLGLRGDSAESAEAVVDHYLRYIERTEGPNALDESLEREIREALDQAYLYGRGGDAYLTWLRSFDDVDSRLQVSLMEGDARAALTLAEETELLLEDTAMLYLLAAEAGAEEAASVYLSRLADGLKASADWETRLIGAVIAGEESQERDQLISLAIAPATKRWCMAALAVRFPENRQHYLELARILNFEFSYPYHVLDAYLTRAGF